MPGESAAAVSESVAFARMNLGAGDRFTSLRRALGVTSLGLNEIVLAPGQRGRIHRHREQEEVYLVVAGALTLVYDGGERTLGPRELARVAPSIRRQLVNRHASPCVVVAIGAAGGYVGRDGEAFADWDAAAGAPPQEVPLPPDLPAVGSEGGAAERRVRESFARQGFMHLLGARLGAVRDGEVEIELPFDETLSQQHGYLHAGAVAAVVDSASGYAALTRLPWDAAVLTVEFKLNLLAPAEGDAVLARGAVVRAGKTLTVCRGDAYSRGAEGERHVATALATMIGLPGGDRTG